MYTCISHVFVENYFNAMFTIIQLPSPICLNQDVNYTIIVINNESNLTKHYGPYRHVGPGTVKHDLVSGLERNQEYSVYIEVEISRNVTVVSNDTRFSKYDCGQHRATPATYGDLSIPSVHTVRSLSLDNINRPLLIFMQTRTFKMKGKCSAQKV